MDIKQLQHFVAAADAQSIVRAAERIGITQSGLSRSLQALETAVGLPLFERRGKGVVPTEFGRELLPRARAILNERDRTLRELRAFDRLEQGGLSIGVMPSFNYTVAPDLIADLINASTGIELGVTTGTYRELIGKLTGAELHFALLLAVVPDRSDLVFHRLYESESAVFAARNHPLAKTRKSGRPGIRDLLDYPWALTESRPLKLAFEGFFRARTDTVPSLRLTCASIALLVQSMQATPLLSVLPRQFENSALFGGQLARIDVASPAGEASAWLVTRPHQVQGPALRLALECLTRRFPAAELPRPGRA